MKCPRRIAPCLALACALLLPACGDSAASGGPTEDPVVARVDGAAITRSALDHEIAMRHPQAAGTAPAAIKDREQLAARILDVMIERTVLENEAEREGVAASDAEVDAKWAEILRRASASRPGSSIQELLAQQNTTEAEVRQSLKTQLSIQHLLDKHVRSKVRVEDADVRAHFEKHAERYQKPATVRARHILIRTDAKGTTEAQKAEAKAKLEKIRAKLVAKGGEGFEEAAGKHSDCPSSKEGGDLKYFRKQDMVPPFAEAAFGAEIGEITDVVETTFGFHVIKVEDKKPAVPMPFEQVAPRIRQELEGRALQVNQKAYVDQLRKAARVEMVDAR